MYVIYKILFIFFREINDFQYLLIGSYQNKREVKVPTIYFAQCVLLLLSIYCYWLIPNLVWLFLDINYKLIFFLIFVFPFQTICLFFGFCQVGRPRKSSSGIPRSRGSSRDASPSSRYGGRYAHATSHGGQQQAGQLRASAERTLPKRPLLTENILKQSREAESALADALVSFYLLYCTFGTVEYGALLPCENIK